LELRAYIIRRLLLLIPVLFGLTLLVFGITMLFTPIERAALYITSPKQLTPQYIDEIVHRYGLDRPFYEQYGTWLNQVLHGNLGWSTVAGLPVGKAILCYLPASLELAIFASPIIIFVGIFLGTKAAARKGTAVDHIVRLVAIMGWSLPVFVLGLFLLMFFTGVIRGLLPAGRLTTPIELFVNSAAFIRYTGINTIDAILNLNGAVLLDALRHLILPVVTLATIQMAFIMRLMRSSMLESLGKGYVLTARAKGLDERVVLNKHARRNALIPVITVSGYLVAGLAGGAVITETIFNFKGIGWWAAQSALQIDIPAVLGFTMFIGVVFVLVNLIVDIIYTRIDPRVRLGEGVQ
jgi:ABC-type dipeptide/oligopeptide/nickel transport system permease component